jgi:hypothetical protein
VAEVADGGGEEVRQVEEVEEELVEVKHLGLVPRPWYLLVVVGLPLVEAAGLLFWSVSQLATPQMSLLVPFGYVPETSEENVVDEDLGH